MSVAGRGIRNAFRNRTRSISIVMILGLVIGLAFVMLTARRWQERLDGAELVRQHR